MAISGAGGFWAGEAGEWQITFSESYDDGGPGDVDAIWTDFSLEFQDLVVEEPDPTPVGVPSVTSDSLLSGEVDWYSFTITGRQVIDIYTMPGDIGDTELGLYTDAGALIATNDDGGPGGGYYSGLMAQDLAAGEYYLAVAGYNATFGAAGWAVTGGTAEGTYDLHITPEPASLALLMLGGLAILRRR